MDFKTFMFYFLSAIVVYGAVRVITSRNPVHAALHLVLTFFTAAGLWLLLHAEFLALMLVMVYVGAVTVLFLFVVMMLDINIERMRQGFWSNLWVGLPIAVLMVVEMGLVLSGRYFATEELPTPAAAPADYSNTRELGSVIYTDYIYQFELASVILLVAMVAAVALTLRKRRDTKRVDPSEQLAAKRDDRVRLVTMPAEKS